ncbi:PDR/VanB family oxidoreductase [soil metagenome]
MSTTTLQALVKSMRHEADGVVSVELVPAAGAVFPPFTAGSHVDLHLANGLVRSYSLLNDQRESGRYVVGVLNDRTSRGGSRYMHTQLRPGMVVPISAPRNNFKLHEDAPTTHLVAGGIGVTPLLSMARRLKELGKPVEMLFCARSQAEAAFIPELKELGIPVTWHFDKDAGSPPDLKGYLADKPHEAFFYSCGPAPMLDAFERICKELGHPNAHIERFSAVAVAPSVEAHSTYEVELRRSGKTIKVSADKSLLASILEADVDCAYSCEEGICGACETKVLEGIPDHRDQVLSDAEHASNKTMMVCVSGCKSDRLVLDL